MKSSFFTASAALCAALALPLTALPASAETADKAAEAGKTSESPSVEILSTEGLPPIWLQGDPIKEFAQDKLYIFEFWATWCGPCLQAMPHMEALHQTFKEDEKIAIIGVNVMDETPSDRLMGFLKSKKLTPSYPMAADKGRTGPVAKHWLAPLKINAIPHAIAVRNGQVIWRGHPASLSKDTITTLSNPDFKAGTPVADLATEKRDAQHKLTREIMITASEAPAAAVELLNNLATEGNHSNAEMVNNYQTAFETHLRYDRLEAARTLIKEMVAHLPDDRNALLSASSMLIHTEEFEGKDSAQAIEYTDLVLAKNEKDIQALELKAAALFQSGDAKAAAELQQKALESTKLHAEIKALRAELAQ